MREVPISGTTGAPRVDVCRRCEFLWFDPSEFEQLPSRPAPEEPPLSEQAQEILATAKAQAIAERARGGEYSTEPPDELWKYLPALLGMPVEYDVSTFRQLPWMTWALVAFITGVSIAAWQNLDAAVATYALVPAQPLRHGGLTFLTSFLLHGGILHLVGNMYFLLVFGDNVEDVLGKTRYLMLLLLAAFVGDLLHIAFDPRQTIPVIGASGGISGIVAYYALKYPRARLGFLLRIIVYFRWIRIPAYAYMGFWVVLQVAGAFEQIRGVTNVSALAHLGGATVGVIFWLATRKG